MPAWTASAPLNRLRTVQSQSWPCGDRTIQNGPLKNRIAAGAQLLSVTGRSSNSVITNSQNIPATASAGMVSTSGWPTACHRCCDSQISQLMTLRLVSAATRRACRLTAPCCRLRPSTAMTPTAMPRTNMSSTVRESITREA
jgi:hypothetical protein